MKTTFKPLGIAAAVAAATAGYAGIANAVELADNSGLGDLAIVPYFTTQAGFSTGISIINTSSYTQVVKMRLRRARDSMDALDFNVILSPDDVYTGYVQRDGDAEDAEIRWYSNDASCTAPQYSVVSADGPSYFIMPDIYREGAEEGYIEVIGMAAADSAQPIYASSLHTNGVPFDCARVRDNFFPGNSTTDYGTTANLSRKGVIDSATTHQLTAAGSTTVTPNSYLDTGNVLKVSYFIKNDATGLEFGNDATHIANFMEGPSMTNQRLGLFEGDLQGFDYPDLNGGAVYSAVVDPIAGVGQRGRYELLRNDAIGGTEVINDWSENTTDMFTVDTDWIVTTPGQYLMTNLFAYLVSQAEGSTTTCGGGDPSADYDSGTGANCDFRDIPMTALFTVFDREERGIVVDEGDLVVSPQPPGEIIEDVLDQEVNVIRWGTEKVLGSNKEITVPKPSGATAGWARLGVTPNGSTTQAICDIYDISQAPNGQPSLPTYPLPQSCSATDSPIPLVGFVAWQRNFGDLPEANYGRIIRHSYTVVSS
jgi:hypothetical protein